MSEYSSWAEDLVKALRENKEDISTDVVGCVPALDSAEMTTEFYHGYGTARGCSFTLWTKKHIYFEDEYDGSLRVVSRPRNPPRKKGKIK